MKGARWHRRRGCRVDTHILLHHSMQNPAWLEQCLASMEGEDTNILLVDAPTLHLGRARALAMSEGNAPLLSFVSDDGWVMSGVFTACINALADLTLVGVYTDSSDVDCATGRIIGSHVKRPWSAHNQLLHPSEVSHVHVYRRAPAMKHLDEMAQWHAAEESLLMGLLVQDGAWRKLEFDGYRKRPYVTGSRITPAMLRDLTKRLSPILLAKPPAPAKPSRIRRWASMPTGCSGCDRARRAIGKALSQ